MRSRGVASIAGLFACVALVGCNVGCNATPEKALLDQFFAASRLRDKTALATISTVVFEPREQGTVVDFEITGVQITGRDAMNVAKEVTLSALVRQPDGQTVRKTLIVTIAGSMVTAVKSGS